MLITISFFFSFQEFYGLCGKHWPTQTINFQLGQVYIMDEERGGEGGEGKNGGGGEKWEGEGREWEGEGERRGGGRGGGREGEGEGNGTFIP